MISPIAVATALYDLAKSLIEAGLAASASNGAIEGQSLDPYALIFSGGVTLASLSAAAALDRGREELERERYDPYPAEGSEVAKDLWGRRRMWEEHYRAEYSPTIWIEYGPDDITFNTPSVVIKGKIVRDR